MQKTQRVANIFEGLQTQKIPAMFSEDQSALYFDENVNTDNSKWQIKVSLFNKDKDKYVKITKVSWVKEQSVQLPPELEAHINVITTTKLDKIKKADTTVINKGKNLGRKNETNVLAQAIYEAHSLYNNKLKKNIVVVDKPLPMLLQSYNDKPPSASDYEKGLLCQYKYDGIRAVAFRDTDKKIKFYSRTGHEYLNLDHLAKEIDDLIGNSKMYIDGEFYIHSKPLQDISGIVRGVSNPERVNLKYNIFDCFDPKKKELTQKTRNDILQMLFTDREYENICLVPSHIFHTVEEVDEFYKKALNEKYEGIVLRKMDKEYKYSTNNYHTNNILKRKPLPTAEYKIVDYDAGKRGKDKDAIIFIMETKEGNRFNAVPNMPIEDRKKLYKEIKKEDYIGKMATIQYSTLSKLNTPQQPKFVAVRDYE